MGSYMTKKFGCKIEGVTMVTFEIEKANKLAKLIGVCDNVRYSLMDYSNMKFSNDYFDRIYTIETLCHSNDIKKTLKEFFRVLKKGSKVAFFEYNIAKDDKFNKHELEVIDKVIYSTAADSLKDFRPNKFEKIIKDAGFKNIKVDDLTENVKPSWNRFRRFALIPYSLMKFFNLHRNFTNLMIAIEFYKLIDHN